MIGTPDLSRVYSWRLNSCTSIERDLFLEQRVATSSTLLAAGAGHRLLGGADLDRRDAAAEQLVGHGAAVGAFEHALQQFAARVAAL